MNFSLFSLSYIPEPLGTLLYLAWVAGACMFLLSRRRRPVTTLAWLLAFVSFPVIALIMYVLVGPGRLEGLRRHRRSVVDCVHRYVPQNANDLPTAFEHEMPEYFGLASVTREAGIPSPAPARASGLSYYLDGDSAYPAIEASMAAAKQSIHIEYYIYEPAVVGRRWRDLLVQRATEGVKVRLVVDAVGAHSCESEFWAPLINAGGEVRIFNPLRLFSPRPGRVNFRSHRKIVVVDGIVAYTGGLNVSDQNCTQDDGSLPWRNTHVCVEGPPARDFQQTFLEDWLYAVTVDDRNSNKAWFKQRYKRVNDLDMPVDLDTWFTEETCDNGPWVQVVTSGPEEQSHDVHRLFFTAINLAKQRLWITTPYFVPDEAILTSIAAAAARKVDVRIIIPCEGD